MAVVLEPGYQPIVKLKQKRAFSNTDRPQNRSTSFLLVRGGSWCQRELYPSQTRDESESSNVLTEAEKKAKKAQRERERPKHRAELYEKLKEQLAGVTNATPPGTHAETLGEAAVMLQTLQSGTDHIQAYVPPAREGLQFGAAATPSETDPPLHLKITTPSTTSSPQDVPQLASSSTTFGGKKKSNDLTQAMTESGDEMKRAITDEDGEDQDGSKRFKVTDPFNIVRPRCPNCRAVRCIKDHSEDWCDCSQSDPRRLDAQATAMSSPEKPRTVAEDSSFDTAKSPTVTDQPKLSAEDSSAELPKATAKDTALPESMKKVLARPNFKAKSSKRASKKAGSTASKAPSALSRAMSRADQETKSDIVHEPLDSPDAETSRPPKSTKARKSAPAISNSTGSKLLRIATTTAAGMKGQDPDLNEFGETRKRKRGEGKTQAAKKRDTEDEKLWKPADPLNVQFPRCAGCQAVFCTCGYKPEYCSCTCWSCGRKAGGKL
ncbi:uncharacterized protein MYCFIDRAFT_78246 [Pseudocercospora fijiensis CIRAD86]|uniref:Uncharacterized protein n=1 Tax=Pseudocercospora fijiensis (strain CIRAD86) TaxID=383855 RepID=M2YS12_PSEFD|nr:uncharacterized protein MYCFIDRAFT_78246 [Pseudocercospora fijiensis CIRAD86]EME80535.1 hypothetical protein MYCFIDRAFT_78246 [Pseudocercospora fijiensis CIRAD86]